MVLRGAKLLFGKKRDDSSSQTGYSRGFTQRGVEQSGSSSGS